MFKPIHLIPENTSINFLSLKSIFLSISLFVVLISLIASWIIGLNFGIDFRGGVLLELRSKNGFANISELRSKLNRFDLGEVSIQEFGKPTDALIRIQKQDGDEKSQDAKLNKVKEMLAINYEIRRTEFVGPTVGEELKRNGFWAVVVALFGILMYIWFRFEWQFALSAILALFHDVIATIGLFVFTGLEFNLSTVAAVLTIAGYSVNDTVVVFDRIREIDKNESDLSYKQKIDIAVSATLTRTLYTSGTTLLPILALIFFGGSTLFWFAIALALGVIVGSWSSIALVPSLLITQKRDI